MQILNLNVPAGIGKLCQLSGLKLHMVLQVLNLDFCTLSELPPSLGPLTALTTLDVEGNPYLGETFRPDNSPVPPAFPCQLSGLQSLKYINLNSCGLTTVPEVTQLWPTDSVIFPAHAWQ